MLVFMISRSGLKMGSKTRSPGQISGNVNTLKVIFYEVIIMNIAQNVCPDDF